MSIIIVTGGAGYLGRCTAEGLAQAGYEPVLLDDFSTGHRESSLRFPTIEVDLSDLDATRKAFDQISRPRGIIHFAAKALVAESCALPEEYFRNNLLATLNTAQCGLEKEVVFFLHSSSCAVYGNPHHVPISENAPFAPLSPYGETKAISEQILTHLSLHRRLHVLNLRYFNPAGSYQGKIGESHFPETHLIPLAVRAAMQGTELLLFGDGHPTADGTCIRDFIHVEDLVHAHILGLKALEDGKSSGTKALNIGTGKGTSVRQVIETVEKLLGKKILLELHPPRQGDPPELIADPHQAMHLLGWQAKRSLEDMISDHYHWEKKRLG